MNDSALIKLDKITLTLSGHGGDVAILHEISLSVHENETLAIIGPSGSGKTSLLMLMAGLEQATSGDVIVAGQHLGKMSEDALAAFRGANIGVVFQSFHLIPTMTALENVAVPLEFKGDTLATVKAKAALEALGIGHRLTHYPNELSGGEQQRVAIARAFAVAPKLILADEPTGNLDRDTGKQVIDLLFKLHETHGTTLVLITHDPLLAARCKRVIRIGDGQLIKEAS